MAAVVFSFAAFAARAADSSEQGGAGNLLVAPTRVVLEGRTRASEIILSNTGTREATYRLGLIRLHMDDQGSYHEMDEKAHSAAGEKSADALLRFSPKQVTLKPGESQTVKVLARKPEGLAEGEYRSHLSFHAVPDASTGEDVEKINAPEGQIAIRLIPVYGVSIPVVVRHGNLEAQAGITDVKLSGKSLSLTITRSGSKSLYGDLIATQAGKVVGEMHGVAVFVPNRKRQVTIPLTGEASGPLTIEYIGRDPGASQALAKTSVNL